MSLVLKVACPSCGYHQESPIGTEVRCERCGNDFRAVGHGESCTQIVSATPDDLEHVPYSQRSTEVPRNTRSSLVVADPALLDDKLLRDLPMKDNARWCGRVRLIKKLGAGGMGAVYRGFDESLALDVAVKIMPVPPGGKEMHFADRFRMEARISAQINHPNVVRMRDVDEQGGLVYLVMDFVDGITARQMLDRKGFIPVPQALQIIHDASLGMQAAHERGIVHRDIKPENILVANDGRVMLTDLGLAKGAGSRFTDSLLPVTRMGLLLGTPEFMSPEQWDIGASVTPRSDIWSMGVTLWVLLTRRSPFEDADLGLLAKKIKEAPLPDIHVIRPDVPPKVASILYHCLAKNPQRRFMNAAGLVGALVHAMQHPDQADDDFIQTPSSLAIQTADQQTAGVTPASPPPTAGARVVSAQYKNVPALPGPAAKPKAKVEAPVRRKKMTVTRALAWMSLPAAAACAAFAFHHYVGFGHTQSEQKDRPIAQATVEPKAPENPAKALPASPAEPVITLDIAAPQRVKPGEAAVLHATLKGAPDASKYKIVWKSGKDEQTAPEIPAVFDADKEFEVSVIQIDGNKEVAHKRLTVETDLSVSALEVANDNGTATHLEGFVKGGPGSDKIEYRWYETKNPTVTLCDKPVFEPQFGNEAPGLKMYVFQARRKGTRDWTGAPSDKVAVAIRPQVPAEFTQAMKDAEKSRLIADAADTGSAAQAALSEALKAFERALQVLPDNLEVRQAKIECIRRSKAEGEYASLLNEARRFALEANRTPDTAPYDRMKSVELALQPLYSAQQVLKGADLRVHPELLNEIKRMEEMRTACNDFIENDKKAQLDFKTRIDKAREQVEEATKYQDLKVALPYWEQAVQNFRALSKQYPRRVKEFQLELQRAQEKHDAAYLFTHFGIIPGKPEDTIYQKQPKNSPPVPNSPQNGVPAGREKATNQ